MKKIAIVIAELAAPGGAEKVAVDLAEEFRQRNYEVTVIKFARLPPEITRYELPVRMINLDIPERQGGLFTQISLLLQRAWQFRQLFQREKFDHIFSFLEAANVPCALACSDAVLSIHLDPGTMTRSEWLAFRWLYPRAKRVIAVSRQMQNLLEKQAHLSNVNCIYNPVNTRLIREKSQETLGFEGRFILGVGRLEKQKRFDLLIEAFARSKAQQACKLLIVGRGSQQTLLEQKIKALGMEARVVLVGFDANPYKYMAKAEFQVMSSDYEGYPLVLIEALSLGCPIVSTDCPTGPREIIRHGENGLLVEKGNVAALAAGIDELFFDDDKRERLRQQAQESVRANDIVAVADAWLAA
ncbi:glycosyltransferase family 4 protein [Thiothrix subterranea]|uniref:glycosyltransferase family 4 protein n=1 Tax=Thiothrix subterranea TaxID=2735563 RepID=UPI00192C7932|nr:glycosyltransferase family 4 protein [Thiothrix subterranea]QQZ27749.1 glycosyltransferase family 4 protein [Thiothrix subterranea]